MLKLISRFYSTGVKWPEVSVPYRSIIYNNAQRNGKLAVISLNRPQRLNAIDQYMPGELEHAVHAANEDGDVKLILLEGTGKAFCSGYDLKMFAESGRGHPCSQEMPWDPYLDYKFMSRCTECFMSVFHSLKPVVCKIRGVCIGGGSDIALCSDVTFISSDAVIGYPPSRVWGCPTTAMWVYRVGAERAKRILFTGDLLSGEDAANIGLIGQSVRDSELDDVVDSFINRIMDVPTNQLFFQKQVINNVLEMSGVGTSQRLATLFDGMSRHTPEGVSFQQRAQKVGFKQAVRERDSGLMDGWQS